MSIWYTFYIFCYCLIMRKVIILFFVCVLGLYYTSIYAEMGIPGSNSTTYGSNPIQPNTNNILWVSKEDLRSGNVNMSTIPLVIVSIISTLLAVAGTIAIFSLIYHAVQMQINSGITGDSSGVDKAKKWMVWALIWFVIAISAWFLVTRAAELLWAVS